MYICTSIYTIWGVLARYSFNDSLDMSEIVPRAEVKASLWLVLWHLLDIYDWLPFRSVAQVWLWTSMSSSSCVGSTIGNGTVLDIDFWFLWKGILWTACCNAGPHSHSATLLPIINQHVPPGTRSFRRLDCIRSQIWNHTEFCWFTGSDITQQHGGKRVNVNINQRS